MNSVASIDDLDDERKHRIISWLLLIGLLILRLPILGSIALFPASSRPWVDAVYDVGTYSLTACFIWWERKHWADFHVDTLAVAIIVLFKPLETLILALALAKAPALAPHGPHPLAFPRPLAVSIWLIAGTLVIALRRSGIGISIIPKVSFQWFLIGMVVGLATALLLAYPLSLQITESDFLDNTVPTNRAPIAQTLVKAMYAFVYQLGMAAVSEEPLFRGFLWGHLRKLNWREMWIWLFQAGLFSLAHIYYLWSHPISFWLVVPFSGLVLGLMAWRSRSIATSMATHGAINGWGSMLADSIYIHGH